MTSHVISLTCISYVKLYAILNVIYDIIYDTVFHPTMQVLFVNEATWIRKAQHGSPLHCLAPIVDPSDAIIGVLLAAVRWDIQQRRFGLTAEGLDKLHALSVELLDLLVENMPDRTGGVKGWNSGKAHSILYKVRDILLLGWSEKFSHQGPLALASPCKTTTRAFIMK